MNKNNAKIATLVKSKELNIFFNQRIHTKLTPPELQRQSTA